MAGLKFPARCGDLREERADCFPAKRQSPLTAIDEGMRLKKGRHSVHVSRPLVGYRMHISLSRWKEAKLLGIIALSRLRKRGQGSRRVCESDSPCGEGKNTRGSVKDHFALAQRLAHSQQRHRRSAAIIADGFDRQISAHLV